MFNFRISMPWWVVVVVGGVLLAQPHQVAAESNYDKQAQSVTYEGVGIPEFATLNGTVTELGKYSFPLHICI